jgi:nucleoside-diphosphate-sugar epimerase
VLSHTNLTPTPPKRAVIIGAGGFVGSSIQKAVAVARVPVLALTQKDVNLLAPDCVPQLAAHLEPSDAVVFAAAVAPARTSVQLMANLRMSEAATLAFARVPPAHLLYLSSDAVYADDAVPVTESSPVAPSTMHGIMHAARELMFRTQVNAPFAVLRPTLIYGAADPHSGYGPNRFRRQATAGEPISIFGEGEEKRDHVSVEDVAQLAMRMLMHRSIGALNAATGAATSFRAIADLVARQFAPRAMVLSVPRTGPRPHLEHRFFDIAACHKAFPDFRYEPLGEGLARVHRECTLHEIEVGRA